MRWGNGLGTSRIKSQGNWTDTAIQICVGRCSYMLTHWNVAENSFSQEDCLLESHNFYFVGCFQMLLFKTQKVKKKNLKKKTQCSKVIGPLWIGYHVIVVNTCLRNGLKKNKLILKQFPYIFKNASPWFLPLTFLSSYRGLKRKKKMRPSLLLTKVASKLFLEDFLSPDSGDNGAWEEWWTLCALWLSEH